jgi:hypothetical protein
MNEAERLSAARAAHKRLVETINNVTAKLKSAESDVFGFKKQLDEEEAARQAAITSGKYAFIRSLNAVTSKLSDANADVVSFKTALATLNEQLAVATKELAAATAAERDVRRRAAVAKFVAVLRGPFRQAHNELLAIWDESARGDSFLLIDQVLLETYLSAADAYIAGPKALARPRLPKGHVVVRFVESFNGAQLGDNINARLRFLLPYPKGETASFPEYDAKALIEAGFAVEA